MANASTLRQVPVPATAAKPTQTCPAQPLPNLPPIDPSLTASQSRPPIKCIHTEEDVGTWRASEAHQITVLFVSRLCEAAVGKRTRAWQMSAVRGEQATTAGQVEPSEDAIDRVGRLLYQLERWTQEVEPLSTPQRFGNLAFRTWGQRLEEVSALRVASPKQPGGRCSIADPAALDRISLLYILSCFQPLCMDSFQSWKRTCWAHLGHGHGLTTDLGTSLASLHGFAF